MCYINLKNFDSALDLIGGRDELMFEKAYCLYRKNDVSIEYKSIYTSEVDPMQYSSKVHCLFALGLLILNRTRFRI